MTLGHSRIFACALSLALAAFAADTKTKPAELDGKDIAGHRVNLRETRGQLVVVNLWATWCGPCKDELPALVKIANEYAPRGVAFIAASIDERSTQARVVDFIARYQISFPVWTGVSADALDRLKLGPAVPATAVLDRDGRIVFRFSGEFRADELRARLDWLLGDRRSPEPEAFVTHLEPAPKASHN